MKFQSILLLPLLAALALCGCDTVTSKKPVGDKAAELKPEDWNGKWQDGKGTFVVTRIKDAKSGIVEAKYIQPWTKSKPGDVTTDDLLVRKLGAEVIANRGDINGYEFGRVAADGSHLLVFYPDTPVFLKLIKRHMIAGRIDRDKDGKPTHSCTVEEFSERDYQRLKNEGFDVRSLFEEDPSMVLTRDHGLW
jgi:hypothetical protein